MRKVKHINPDGKSVFISIGDEAIIGEGASILPYIVVPNGLNGCSFRGLNVVATVNDDEITMGCHTKTIKDHLKMTPEEAEEIGMPLHLFDGYMAFVKMVAKYQREHQV